MSASLNPSCVLLVMPAWVSTQNVTSSGNYVYACPNCQHVAPQNWICPYVQAVSCGGPLRCPFCAINGEVIV